jgi:hypothetical protein
MFFWLNCNFNKAFVVPILAWWYVLRTFWNSCDIDYFQSSWNISTWCDTSPMWSRFTCWRSLGLLQSLYWWCLFPSKFPILMKISSFCCVPFLFFTNICLYCTGHAECVRFVKRFNLPLLVGLYHFMFAFHSLAQWVRLTWMDLYHRSLEVGATQKKMLLDVGLLKLEFF